MGGALVRHVSDNGMKDTAVGATTGVLFPDLSAGARELVGNSGAVNLSLGYQRQSDSHLRMNRLVAGVGVSLLP